MCVFFFSCSGDKSYGSVANDYQDEKGQRETQNNYFLCNIPIKFLKNSFIESSSTAPK
jgi:hypothetical protein